MLHPASKLLNLELRARDGVLGTVKDYYFDDHRWTLRYLVVETGSWLESRRVLIAASALFAIDWSQGLLHVDLTRNQVRNSPGTDTEQPVTRGHEVDLHRHYGWGAYWMGAGYPFAGDALAAPIPDVGGVATAGAAIPVSDVPLRRTAPDGDPALRAGKTVRGYHIEAVDGAVGHVADFLFDDSSWKIRYAVADTRNWLPGRRVLIAPEWISEVKWSDSRVYVDLPKERIKSAPVYDASRPPDPGYLGRLDAHYRDISVH